MLKNCPVGGPRPVHVYERKNTKSLKRTKRVKKGKHNPRLTIHRHMGCGQITPLAPHL